MTNPRGKATAAMEFPCEHCRALTMATQIQTLNGYALCPVCHHAVMTHQVKLKGHHR